MNVSIIIDKDRCYVGRFNPKYATRNELLLNHYPNSKPTPKRKTNNNAASAICFK